MYRKTLLLGLSVIAAPLIALGAATPALAFSDDSTSYDPSVQSNFADPDEAMDNLANSASGSGGTEVSAHTDGSESAHNVTLPPATPSDAEPVNPAWPMWMQWHQQ